MTSLFLLLSYLLYLPCWALELCVSPGGCELLESNCLDSTTLSDFKSCISKAPTFCEWGVTPKTSVVKAQFCPAGDAFHFEPVQETEVIGGLSQTSRHASVTLSIAPTIGCQAQVYGVSTECVQENYMTTAHFSQSSTEAGMLMTELFASYTVTPNCGTVISATVDYTDVRAQGQAKVQILPAETDVTFDASSSCSQCDTISTPEELLDCLRHNEDTCEITATRVLDGSFDITSYSLLLPSCGSGIDLSLKWTDFPSFDYWDHKIRNRSTIEGLLILTAADGVDMTTCELMTTHDSCVTFDKANEQLNLHTYSDSVALSFSTPTSLSDDVILLGDYKMKDGLFQNVKLVNVYRGFRSLFALTRSTFIFRNSLEVTADSLGLVEWCDFTGLNDGEIKAQIEKCVAVLNTNYQVHVIDRTSGTATGITDSVKFCSHTQDGISYMGFPTFFLTGVPLTETGALKGEISASLVGATDGCELEVFLRDKECNDVTTSGLSVGSVTVTDSHVTIPINLFDVPVATHNIMLRTACAEGVTIEELEMLGEGFDIVFTFPGTRETEPLEPDSVTILTNDASCTIFSCLSVTNSDALDLCLRRAPTKCEYEAEYNVSGRVVSRVCTKSMMVDMGIDNLMQSSTISSTGTISVQFYLDSSLLPDTCAYDIYALSTLDCSATESDSMYIIASGVAIKDSAVTLPSTQLDLTKLVFYLIPKTGDCAAPISKAEYLTPSILLVKSSGMGFHYSEVSSNFQLVSGNADCPQDCPGNHSNLLPEEIASCLKGASEECMYQWTHHLQVEGDDTCQLLLMIDIASLRPNQGAWVPYKANATLELQLLTEPAREDCVAQIGHSNATCSDVAGQNVKWVAQGNNKLKLKKGVKKYRDSHHESLILSHRGYAWVMDDLKPLGLEPECGTRFEHYAAEIEGLVSGRGYAELLEYPDKATDPPPSGVPSTIMFCTSSLMFFVLHA